MSDEHIDEISGVSTTGHEWDGIRELNNPLPRWWVITFYVTIVWAIGYTIAYPAWPLLHSATKGVLGYSSRNEVRNELTAAEAAKGKYISAVESK
ncbi:MAG: cytochrome C oxidase Cbb3, partial [Mesorhizobium sp.]